MMGLSLPHLLIVAVMVLVLFGRGRISEMMGDFGKGIKSFKQGLHEDETKHVVVPPVQLPTQPAAQPHATLNGETVVDPNQPAR